MSSLFIFGNGFDIAHSLSTKYSDFRKYLIEKYNINYDYNKQSSFNELFEKDIDKLSVNYCFQQWMMLLMKIGLILRMHLVILTFKGNFPKEKIPKMNMEIIMMITLWNIYR